MKTLVFGEILWDIIDGKPCLGGAPLNFAAHLVQCGEEATIISALGLDELGDNAISAVKNLGVNTSLIQRNEKRTGVVPVSLIGGEPSYEIIPDVAYDYINQIHINTSSLEQFYSFYFGTLIQRNEESKTTLLKILSTKQFENIFYDVNLRDNCYTEESIQTGLQYCTVLKLNKDEVLTLSHLISEIHSNSLELFCETVSSLYSQIEVIIITAGADGSYIWSNNTLINVPSYPIDLVDAVGAGDSYSAAFITILHRTGDPKEAAKVASKIGAFVAGSNGAIPKYPENLKRIFN
ncbi:MAG: PfkB family carbohydrate kinase [Fulvivirga sp.]